MKLNSIIHESILLNEEVIAEDTVVVLEELEWVGKDIQRIRTILKDNTLNEEDIKEVNSIITKLDEVLDQEGITMLAEAVDRQFRRYGDKFLRQYRCTTGPKAGRLVTSPEKCGKRKDPRRVRIGKRAARVKKGIRVRKTLFTKRKTASKRLTRLNKVLRGDL